MQMNIFNINNVIILKETLPSWNTIFLSEDSRNTQFSRKNKQNTGNYFI